MATYKLTITSAQGINTGLTRAVALFATPVSGDVEPYSQKVYVLDGSSSVMGVSPVQKNVIILSQILSNTSAIRAVGYTRIGVCLNSDGSVDWDAPVIYHPQMGGWLQCPGILTAYGTKILRGYDKGTYREGHYSIRLPSSSSLSCGYVEIDYILYAPATVTIDNAAGTAPAQYTTSEGASGTVAAGATQAIQAAIGGTVAVSTVRDTYEKRLDGMTCTAGTPASTSSTEATFAIAKAGAITLNWEAQDSCDFLAPTGCSYRVTVTWGGATVATHDLAAGERCTVYLPSTKPTVTASNCRLAEDYFFYQWVATTASGSTIILSAPVTFAGTFAAPASGRTYHPRLRHPFTVTIVAPGKTAIAYHFGLDGKTYRDDNGEQLEGTIPAGTSRDFTLYRETDPGVTTDKNITLTLEAAAFDYRTFGGWTRDGTVFDRWSNPAITTANEPATYSCAIGETGGGDVDGLLCDDTSSSAPLLYADGPARHPKTHTVQVSAAYEGGSHYIDWEIGDHSGQHEDIETNWDKTVAVQIGGASGDAPDTGALLYADGKTTDIPPLVRVAFHCQQAEHQYAVTVTIDGTQVDAQTNLSGPYSKTFPLP